MLYILKKLGEGNKSIREEVSLTGKSEVSLIFID